MLNHVFVYGTLKRGYNNNRLLEGEVFVSEASTNEKLYVLKDVGVPVATLPALVPHLLPLPIKGEVWTLSDKHVLKDLDSLEGYYENLDDEYGGYVRREINVKNEKDIIIPCYIYEFHSTYNRENVLSDVVEWDGIKHYEWNR